MHDQVIGWDIGGAHLKAALLNRNGELLQMHQVACPLWLGLDKLETAFDCILEKFDIQASCAEHAVTMTGELVDLFEGRDDGVRQIAKMTALKLGQRIRFYQMSQSNEDAFLTFDAVDVNTHVVASANWHASARLLSGYMREALLIDIGSSTTDIIAINNGHLSSSAYSDAERMQQDTLVYTGVVRTPVMAITQKLLVDSKESNVAAEHFATMADVYRLTGSLVEEMDMTETADGAEKTVFASARRLARMVGYDVNDKAMSVWQALAHDCQQRQLQQIEKAVLTQIGEGMTIVGAGLGAFLVKLLAEQLSYPYTNFTALLENGNQQHDIAVCLPAYAVARLALDNPTL